MLELPHTLLSFALVIGVLVFFHELGHYLAARSVGIKVEVFSIGFGPRLFGWTDRTGTDWRVCLLLLGGYVKMHGMEQPQDVSDEERAAWIPGRTFQGKSVLARAWVIVAGPLANFVLAVVLLFGLFLVDGKPDPRPHVTQLVAGSVAERAGFKAGDMMTQINGTKVGTTDEVLHIISANAGKRIDITVQRQDTTLDLPVTPVATGGVGRIGVYLGQGPGLHVSPSWALAGALVASYEVASSELDALGQIIVGNESTNDLSGAIGIAQASGEAARAGIPDLVQLIALVSVNLGLVNLFPIPVLDGGHLVFLAIEAVRRKPLPPRFHAFALYLGLSFIGLLLLIGARNDLGRLGLFHWLAKIF